MIENYKPRLHLLKKSVEMLHDFQKLAEREFRVISTIARLRFMQLDINYEKLNTKIHCRDYNEKHLIIVLEHCTRQPCDFIYCKICLLTAVFF